MRQRRSRHTSRPEHPLRRAARARVLAACVLGLLATALPTASQPLVAADPAAPYRAASAELIGKALLSNEPYEKLVYLCDRIGNRFSGSEALDRAIEWAAEAMRKDGLQNVRTEEVMVPVWVRGLERATLLEPRERDLPVLGLGGSVGTPEDGVTAEVLVTDSFEHLEALGEAVRGKIVLFDVPFTTYGETVRYRTRGAAEAGKRGAVAVLVRSITPVSLMTPHTGNMNYREGDGELPEAMKIPAAAVTLEDAAMLRRLQERGVRPRVRLEMGARTLPDAPSANVIGEVLGREAPEEIVLLACHLDSWDVGQGAQDDGAGCVLVMEAARLIGTLSTPPRRTVRVVLYTNEENGVRGGRAYRDAHGAELPRHVAAIESDSGGGRAAGFTLDVRAGTEEQQAATRASVQQKLRVLEPLLGHLGGSRVAPGFGGVDITPLVEAGVIGFGVDHDTTGYWPIHHTEADTIEKIEPAELARNVALTAVLAYVLAEMPERLPGPVSEPE
jgi:carboxypeptidase Q